MGQPLSRVSAAMRAEPALLETKGHHRVAAHVIAGCCEGIHAAHQLSGGHAPRDVVHRDLTPENLFVLHDGTVRVTDFGILHARTRRRRPSGEMVLKGKAGYLSPEYLRRAPSDRRADVWTLGVVLWELLTGTRRFFRPRESDRLAAVLEAPIAPPSAIRRDVSRMLDAIVARSVTRDVDARYRTAEEMARDLHADLSSEGAVGTQDVGAWLHQVLPDSLRSQTALVESARLRRAAPAPCVPRRAWHPRSVSGNRPTPSASLSRAEPAWGGDPKKPRFFGEGRREPPLDDQVRRSLSGFDRQTPSVEIARVSVTSKSVDSSSGSGTPPRTAGTWRYETFRSTKSGSTSRLSWSRMGLVAEFSRGLPLRSATRRASPC